MPDYAFYRPKRACVTCGEHMEQRYLDEDGKCHLCAMKKDEDDESEE